MKTLAERVRGYRGEKRLSQSEFGALVSDGRSAKWVARIEAGEAPVKIGDVMALSRMLGVDQGELLAEFAEAVAS